jgi:hypothetical protein
VSERAKIERLRRMLRRRCLLFVQVGDRVAQDRVIDTMIDTRVQDRYGGTKTNPEYNKLLRDIVRLVESP